MTPNARANLLTALAAALIIAAGLGTGYWVVHGNDTPAAGETVAPIEYTVAGAADVEAANATAIMISRSTCPHCARAKAWLAQHPELKVVVWENESDLVRSSLAQRLNTRVVPTLVLRDRVLRGFSEQNWAAALRGDPAR